jgi:hypothetical protein
MDKWMMSGIIKKNYFMYRMRGKGRKSGCFIAWNKQIFLRLYILCLGIRILENMDPYLVLRTPREGYSPPSRTALGTPSTAPQALPPGVYSLVSSHACCSYPLSALVCACYCTECGMCSS